MLELTLDHPLILCIPVYNDWESALLLLAEVDTVVAKQGWPARVLFVDDGSTEEVPARTGMALRGLLGAEVLRLRCNVGHQRAIALGLTYIHQHRPSALVAVMDGDGEDAPADLPRLVACLRESSRPRVVFAQRARRSEGSLFRLFYSLFKLGHRVMVGRRVDVGNFSIVPRELLERLVGVGDLWNHYAAAVVKSRLPVAKVPIARGQRLRGRSHMNFIGLVSHGLSAMSVYSEEIGTRLLALTCALFLVAFVGLLVVMGVRLFTDLAIPGWATTTALGISSLLMNALLLGLAFSFLVLKGRNASTFIPLRDYSYFIQGVTHLNGTP
jgi:hypothetical protein